MADVAAIKAIMGGVSPGATEKDLSYGKSISKRVGMLLFLADTEQRFDMLRSIVDAAKDALFDKTYEEISAKTDSIVQFRSSLTRVFECLKAVRDASNTDKAFWNEGERTCTDDFQWDADMIDRCVIGKGPSAQDLNEVSAELMHYVLGERMIGEARAAAGSSDRIDPHLADQLRSFMDYVFLFSWQANLLKYSGSAGGIPMAGTEGDYDKRLEDFSVASSVVMTYAAKGMETLFDGTGKAADRMRGSLDRLYSGSLPTKLPPASKDGYEGIDGYVAPLQYYGGGPSIQCDQ